MRWIRSLLAASWSERWLLVKAWALVAAVRLSLQTLKYARTRRLLERFQGRALVRRGAVAERPERLARIVEVASALVPAGRHCLTRAMALETLLLRRGHPARVEFGVLRTAQQDLEAHAWVLCDGRILIGGESAARFAALSPPPTARR